MSSRDRQPSPGLRQLLESKLDTYEKLELVVVLSRRDEASLAELARELQVGGDVLRRLVLDLSRTGLVALSLDERVRLAATPDELAVIAEGAQLCRSDRGTVIQLLSAIALDRIRGMSARSVADAVALRRKKEEDGEG